MELYKIAASNLYGIGIKKLKLLCEKSGGLNALFEEDLNSLSTRCGINKKLLNNMNRNNALIEAQKQLDFNQKYGVETLFFNDDKYPHLLKECPDAPITLYFKGNISLQHRIIAVVGTRKPSKYGKENVEKLISSFQGQKIIIASGLAMGIDTFVHECCLKYNIQTVGVLGHGLDTISPRSNRDLAKKMAAKGGLLTEFGIEHKVTKYSFPKRNRIIAGLSHMTIVIESPRYGGAIITAELANGYNREVMAVPGSVFSNSSKGCNELIKNNKAHLLEDANDLFQLMNWNKAFKIHDSKIHITKNEAVIINILQKENEIHFDKLITYSSFSTSKLQELILKLELKQIVNSLPGAIFRLSHSTIV